MANKIMIGLLIASFIAVAHAGQYCREKQYFGNDKEFYCNSSCCGDSYNRYCCPDLAVAAIVGIVLGSLALIAIIASVIVCVCCCKRSRGQTGQVVGATGVVMGATTVTTAGQPGPYVMSPTQMAYPASYPQPMAQGYPNGNQFAQPPPSYPATQAK